MAIILLLLLLAAVAAAIDLAIPPRPAWFRVLAGRPSAPADDDGGHDTGHDAAHDAADDRPVTAGLFSHELVQQRLDLLAAELQRLDTDRSIFARAFRTYVAKDAYAALLADRTRLARVRTLDLGGVTFDDDVPRVRAMREELEL